VEMSVGDIAKFASFIAHTLHNACVAYTNFEAETRAKAVSPGERPEYIAITVRTKVERAVRDSNRYMSQPWFCQYMWSEGY